MTSYRAPLRDMHFVMFEMPGFAALRALPGCADLDAGSVAPALEAAAKFCADVLRPLNRSGDEESCTLTGDAVRTPREFASAFRAYADGGWAMIAAHPQYGGAHLPHAVRALVEEMVCSANLAFASYTMLIPGAYAALDAHASPSLRQLYLPELVAGRWMATMCLTEAQSGSDLALVRTRALPKDDGSYRVSGTKIFVSAGEHDFADNIVHLVLARLAGAPDGTRGISLFVVPKFIPNGDGTLGPRNDLHCIGVEQKMGQKAAATSTIEFSGAKGWLVGAPHEGLRAMFAMMNGQRLGAAIQGLGIAEAAYQDAVAYARQRLQGRALEPRHRSDGPADPIIVHPDVRRMLLTMRVYVEGMRMLGQDLAQALDRRERHPDAATRADADNYLGLMTPVAKALFSDLGFECANLGLQVLGGHGYIRAHGMEQYVRDVRIAQIYDGTNGIQALDLVRRKLSDGRFTRCFAAPKRALLQALGAEPALREFVQPTEAALACLDEVAARIAATVGADPEEAAANATEFLRQFGLTALACAWTHAASVALPKIDGPDSQFYRAKVSAARYFIRHLLPHADALARSVLAGGRALREFDTTAF